MDNLIGRPISEDLSHLKCPKCGGGNLRKSGLRRLFSLSNGVKTVQAYVCKDCHFQTTKPISGNGDKNA